MDGTVIKKIKNNLESFNVCRRCILRFIGFKEYTGYITKSSITEAFQRILNPSKSNSDDGMMNCSQCCEDDDVYPPTKKLCQTTCVSCLGILQDSCDEMLTKVQFCINENGHIFNDFVLQLSFPVIVDLRDRLFYLHLKDTFLDSYTLSESAIPSAKDVWKWVIGSQLGEMTKSDFSPYSDFQILLSVIYPDCAEECLPLFEKCPEVFPNRKKIKARPEDIYTRSAVMNAMELVSSDIKSIFQFPPSVPDKSCAYKIQCHHSPIYFGGRYNKYSRELPQTPWIVDGERRMESSVNELITDIVENTIKCDRIIFSASGREDVDVKMLGNGRPFVLEVINPRKGKWNNEELKQIENEINEKTKLIFIRNFQQITKQDTLLLKEGEELKRKCYSALCLVRKTLSEDDVLRLENIKDLKLYQKTPLRVLHRRTLAIRERLLHSIKSEIINKNHLRLRLETQAGTYVKEFVHGDFGRTVPNLGMLLNTDADILELDVESIELEWPPQVS